MSALTLWVLFKGYQVATGQSRQSAMELVVTSLRASLIVGVAMGMVSAARPGATEGDGLMSGLYWRLTNGLSSAIVKTVTGGSDGTYAGPIRTCSCADCDDEHRLGPRAWQGA
ncbi:type IV secretion system protein [Xanthomonas campestris pv. phormiicola]|nr:type IV secretion system protein [Xanthomonas campestris pv. phormiicola]UYC18105.1 type IV secretion system protein [Xanthomonas campestris pv. phormiicola]